MSRRMKLDLSIIVQKAIELVDEHGLDQLSIGLLAEKLEVRPPSLYNHLDGLPELKQKLAIQGVKSLQASMLQAAAGRSGDDAIRAISKAYIQFVREHPGLYDASTRFPDANDLDLQQAQESIVQLVLRVLETYHLQDEMAIHMVRGLRSILHGFTSIEQLGGFGMPLDRNKSFSILLNTFIEGIHAVMLNQPET
ncbi:WHG domain-containing protein [Lysinibacillus sp. FSL M8-0216]|uniref:Transcriptional regulator, TetR family n=1 Tax=Lysinibacillus fusiformis TaxID=28031 RepID=A0A1H8ZKC6_9BACI|nr:MULTISPECIES: TetR/AcrR family transcriptional regulator [Lysinibacillus]EAZ86437.1 probable transcriptional regulator, TetR family protein [Bacillus sp. B14905]HAU34081.1 TetR/AcrR family transcriptional regulator [Lysinibacillus sp.]MCG7434781.1 WHG domain-containing protein [Lysinibacillus fusiformis]MED4076051.1 WHG domain-containing protein [Lysinibacillus fusiformis]MED4671089.1 WHG domain-containing protein [Lysinibacillus fusiformis]